MSSQNARLGLVPVTAAAAAACLLIVASMLATPSQCSRYKPVQLESRATPPSIPIGKALVEPIEYKANLALLERLGYIAGSVEILVKFSSVPTPPPMPARNMLMGAYTRKILPMVALLRNKANSKQKESQISLNLDHCYQVVGVDMVYARTLDDLANGHSLKVETGIVHHDHRHDRVEFEPEIGGIKGVPLDGVAKITVTYRDASDSPSGSTCRRGKTMMVTKGVALLKPEHCSQIMPCFEGRNNKAKISMALTIDSHGKTRVVTNMPAVSQPERMDYDNLSLMEQMFDKTPERIPMNELVFISSRFEEPLVGSRTSLIVPLGRRGEADFAFNLLERAFDWFETYTGYKHPLGTFQLVIVPTVPDNWNGFRGLGIGTSMPSQALLDPDDDSNRRGDKIGAAIQVGYEVASQWFGSIVKPRQESDFWITEGLATYTALKMIDKLMPELRVYDYFRSVVSPWILEFDSKNKYPPVATADTANLDQDFYSLRPFKAAAIIDMLAHNVARNPSRFDTIIRALVERRAFTHGISLDDLIEALENRRYDQNQIRELLEPWLGSRGFPVINIRINQQGQACLLQESDQGDTSTIWPIAMQVAYGNGDSIRTEAIPLRDFTRSSGVVCLPTSFRMSPGSGSWLKVSTRNTLVYFKLKHPTLHADEWGRLRMSEPAIEAEPQEGGTFEAREAHRFESQVSHPSASFQPVTENSMSSDGSSTTSRGSDNESDAESPLTQPPAPQEKPGQQV